MEVTERRCDLSEEFIKFIEDLLKSGLENRQEDRECHRINLENAEIDRENLELDRDAADRQLLRFIEVCESHAAEIEKLETRNELLKDLLDSETEVIEALINAGEFLVEFVTAVRKVQQGYANVISVRQVEGTFKLTPAERDELSAKETVQCEHETRSQAVLASLKTVMTERHLRQQAVAEGA